MFHIINQSTPRLRIRINSSILALAFKSRSLSLITSTSYDPQRVSRKRIKSYASTSEDTQSHIRNEKLKHHIFNSQERRSRIRSLVEEKRYVEAIQIANELSRDRSSGTFLDVIAGPEGRDKCTYTESEISMLGELWDACSTNMNIKTMIMCDFATAFDQANDKKRILQIIKLIPKMHLTIPSNLGLCSLALHLAATHASKGWYNKLEEHIVAAIKKHPTISLATLKHQGAISSMLNKEQVHEAAKYLREHAASLEIDAVRWNVVLVALCTQKHQDVAADLYKHWMSVLPPIDQLKQRSNFRSIVPDVYTYRVLLGIPEGRCPISTRYVLERLKQFEIPPNVQLFEQIIRVSMYEGDYSTTLIAWKHVRLRGFKMTNILMKHLIGLIRDFSRQPGHIDDANRLAVMLWDHRGDVFIEIGWYVTFMQVFDQTHDVKRISQLLEVIMSNPERIQSVHDIELISKTLENNNQTDMLHQFKVWLDGDQTV